MVEAAPAQVCRIAVPDQVDDEGLFDGADDVGVDPGVAFEENLRRQRFA